MYDIHVLDPRRARQGRGFLLLTEAEVVELVQALRDKQ